MTQREARAFVYRWLAVTCENVDVAVITDGVLKPQAEKAITKAFDDICDMLHGKADRTKALNGDHWSLIPPLPEPEPTAEEDPDMQSYLERVRGQ